MKGKAVIYLFTILLCGWTINANAQQAGSNTYDFLTLTNSARVGALGGNQVGMHLNDVSLVFHNPANLSSQLHQTMTFNYVPYVSDIKMTYAGYAHTVESVGTFGVSIHSINYGTFDRADVDGNLNGTFSAAEYAINLSYSKVLSPKLRAGISLKPIISNLEQYNSFGLAADLGLLYHSENQLFSAGITLKNVGSQITTYNDTYEPLPTDLQIGISKKLAHAPFRFSLTAQDLFDWNMKYKVEDGNGDIIEGEGNNANGIDQLMRHMVFGLELVPSDNFYVAVGYNHRRRKELGITEKMSTTGFSWGFGFRVYKFHFAYSSARYHLAGSSNHFSISTSLSNFRN
ncbi:type IX secretion system protein PorQ [Carboxylicivirga marina]|uniref:type IX secretion system protein PorQ n=1 Tax=Carboxylicivirga marina TaxID=2800988 RepID=UPI002592446A|nr:type IX secretion system protein PorQ [uncultured Carboxylicivirga sp.]